MIAILATFPLSVQSAYPLLQGQDEFVTIVKDFLVA